MSKEGFKIDIGNGRKVKITQSISDLKEGIKKRDLSRISAYAGKEHAHIGSKSDSVYKKK